MFAHRDPGRVAIIGGGEGATLREVLKHNTVNEVLMIEIDETMMNVSREYLKEWSDCSDLMGSSEWCGDDSRARLVYVDALEWFTGHYGNNSTSDPPIDVIIMDAL
jgi:spermidine synthase